MISYNDIKKMRAKGENHEFFPMDLVPPKWAHEQHDKGISVPGCKQRDKTVPIDALYQYLKNLNLPVNNHEKFLFKSSEGFAWFLSSVYIYTKYKIDLSSRMQKRYVLGEIYDQNRNIFKDLDLIDSKEEYDYCDYDRWSNIYIYEVFKEIYCIYHDFNNIKGLLNNTDRINDYAWWDVIFNILEKFQINYYQNPNNRMVFNTYFVYEEFRDAGEKKINDELLSIIKPLFYEVLDEIENDLEKEIASNPNYKNMTINDLFKNLGNAIHDNSVFYFTKDTILKNVPLDFLEREKFILCNIWEDKCYYLSSLRYLANFTYVYVDAKFFKDYFYNLVLSDWLFKDIFEESSKWLISAKKNYVGMEESKEAPKLTRKKANSKKKATKK